MSLTPVIVELPQYNQNFIVNVPSTSTIQDVKEEISRACPGNPRVDGQRLISRGRILGDTENIESLWTASDVKVIHLAVNPWSWSSGPPEVKRPEPAPTPTISPSQIPHTIQLQQTTVQPPLRRDPQSIADRSQLQPTPFMTQPMRSSNVVPYVIHLHSKALRALAPNSPFPSQQLQDQVRFREYAIVVVQSAGRSWPAIFDEEYPPQTEGGVTYEYTMVGGLPYLQNLTPHATPTLYQRHALNVLTHTFPLLALPEPPSPVFSSWINMRVPQVNLAAQNPGVRFPVRALLTPLFLLAVRTLLLLYFFSPARKPLFSIMVGLWVVYEAWGAIRRAIGNQERRGQAGGADRGNAEEHRGAAPEGAAGVNNGHEQAREGPRNRIAPNPDILFSRLARIHLDDEARALDTTRDDRQTEEPGPFFKIRHFLSLFILTMHPAFWDRRRSLLREREGRLRTEANVLQVARDEGNVEGGVPINERVRLAREQFAAQHARRPIWVREYIERVRSGEWVDD